MVGRLPLRDRWMLRPRVHLVVPPGRPLWPVPREELPPSLPAWFWNFATPCAIVRIYGHIGERVIYQLWWWSRAPVWRISDAAYSLDWKIQGKVKELHEQRVRESRGVFPQLRNSDTGARDDAPVDFV